MELCGSLQLEEVTLTSSILQCEVLQNIALRECVCMYVCGVMLYKG